MMSAVPKGKFRNKSTAIFMGVLTGVSLVAGATDHAYTWTEGGNPAATPDGRVSFTYDGARAIKSMRVLPEDGGKIVFSGASMNFASTCEVTNDAPGELVFENTVTTHIFRIKSPYFATDAAYTYGGHANTFLSADNWTVVFPNAKLDEWEPTTTKMTKPAGETFSGTWENPNNNMSVAVMKRLSASSLTFQFQTAPSDPGEGYPYVSKCVKIELRQNGDNIEARVIKAGTMLASCVCSSRTYPQPVGYDVDDLIASGLYRMSSELVAGNIGSKKLYRNVTGATSGYGINAISFVRRKALTICRFADPTGRSSIQGSTLAAFSGGRIEVAGSATSSVGFYPYAEAPQGTVSIQDRTFTWTGFPTGGNGRIRFETTQALPQAPAFSAPVDYGKTADWYLTNTLTKVASNRRIEDLLTCTNRAWVIESDGYMPNGTTSRGGDGVVADKAFSWCNISGSYAGGEVDKEKHPANLYNLKIDRTVRPLTATVQAQCQQGAMIRFLTITLQQMGNDIYASIGDKAACYVTVTGAVMRADARFGYEKLLGVDCDVFRAMSKEDQGRYEVTLDQATSHKDSGAQFGIRNLNLAFREARQVVTSTRADQSSSNYEIRGCDDARMALQITSFGGLPTNGVVTVGNGGELWYSGTWSATESLHKGVSGGLPTLLVEKGGLVRVNARYPFGPKERIELNGGVLEFGALQGAMSCARDVNAYLYDLTLRDGARISAESGDRVLRLGNKRDCSWLIAGNAPSTNDVPLTFVGDNSHISTVFTFSFGVAETGNGAAPDFVQNAPLEGYIYSEEAYKYDFTNCVVRKTGSGTMLLNGVYSSFGALTVENGTFLMGEKGGWANGAPLKLDANATFALCDGVSIETVGPLSVTATAGAKISLGQGSSLCFADSKGFAWVGPLNVTIPTAPNGSLQAALRFAGGLTSNQRRLLLVNGRHVSLDADGRVFFGGMVVVVR